MTLNQKRLRNNFNDFLARRRRAPATITRHLCAGGPFSEQEICLTTGTTALIKVGQWLGWYVNNSKYGTDRDVEWRNA